MSISLATWPKASRSNSAVEIGVDLVEIARIRQALRRPRFVKKIFSTREIAYCRRRKNFAQHFAVRFAAKEAVWKAIATATLRLPSGQRLRGADLLHRDIEVTNRASGKPEVVLPKRYSLLAKHVSISLSHGRDYAVAMAIYR